MATYKDSVGNTYSRIVHGGPPTHKAKKTRNKEAKRAVRKNAQAKYERYRRTKGRPNGPGQPGNKSGANKIPK